MKSLLGIFQFRFGCRHRHKSGVFTIKNRTYQVCLKCGQEFEYSWVRMRTVQSQRCPRLRRAAEKRSMRQKR